MTNITETERIVDKYTDKIGESLTALAEALKVPAEFVFETLVKMQIVEGVTSLLIGIMVFICSFIALFIGYKTIETKEELSVPCFIFGGFAFVLMLVFTVISGGDVMSQIFVPEYHAIMEIKGFIK